ncbi:MAG: GIM family subclass B1 metallo-beta-lactamase, partial [Reinekea sp.]|nr:GIM family subclass B1 metallo-beta-lactamase [Reinekea sp.]
SIDDWAQSIARIKLKNFAIEIVVPGHGAVGHSDLLDHTITLVESAK